MSTQELDTLEPEVCAAAGVPLYPLIQGAVDVPRFVEVASTDGTKIYSGRTQELVNR